jgi:S-adenosylmethionine synthetase
MFICGGPMGDNGTTGKKLVIDAYGPTVPIGGGAWCGKDFHKPDRAGGMLARRMALECVQLGLGTRIRVQLEYRPNSPAPESVQVWADGRAVELPRTVKVPGTKEIAQEVMRGLERQNFTPLMTGQFARWGHFGSGEWWGVPRPEARKVLNSHSTGPRSS